MQCRLTEALFAGTCMTSDPPRQLELVLDEDNASAVHESLAARNRQTSITSSGSLRS